MNKLLAIACPLLLLVAVAKAHGLAEVDALAGLNYGLGDGEDLLGQGALRARGRFLQQTVETVQGVPKSFTIRPMGDMSLCLHTVDITSSRKVAAARARSGLPPADAAEVAVNGALRLVLLKCGPGLEDTFLAEKLMGRSYQVDNTQYYNNGFLKPVLDPSSCLYGANASYTQGHSVWGYDSWDVVANDQELDWFDDYNFDYAQYTRYGYNMSELAEAHRSPIPLPDQMHDGSGWGPFRANWGPCMANPTADSATPIMPDEVQLQYMSWSFIGPLPDTPAVAHLPAGVRSRAYALLTIGPERPRIVTLDPVTETLVGGSLYGNANLLTSKELCITASNIREGAFLRLEQCNPGKPSFQQMFSLTRVQTPEMAAKKLAREAKQAAKGL